MACLYVAHGVADWLRCPSPFGIVKIGISGDNNPSRRIASHRRSNPFGRPLDLQAIVHFVTADQLEVRRVETEAKRHMLSLGLDNRSRPNGSGEWFIGGPSRSSNVHQVLTVLAGAAGCAIHDRHRSRAWVASLAEAGMFADHQWIEGERGRSTSMDIDDRAGAMFGETAFRHSKSQGVT